MNTNAPTQLKPTLATIALTGCFGCHMSLLDIDERILELVDLVDLDVSPFDDKKAFDRLVDVGFIEGGCSNEYNVRELKTFRNNCRILVSVGACAINGGVPAMRNTIGLRECLEAVYLDGVSLEGKGIIPNDEDLPLLLDRVYPSHEVVKIDYFLPGCPPSGDAIWAGLRALLTGQEPTLPYLLCKYE
jgi:NAD-reducing hydrogenase small subunit